jgi:hypothetical protein
MAFVVCQPTAAVAIKVIIKSIQFGIVIIYIYFLNNFSELYARYYTFFIFFDAFK